MSKITLVTGGSRSGKSSYAERILKKTDDCLYIATATITDGEMEERVRKHKESRNQKWDTFEGFIDLDEAVNNSRHKTIMLDCITNMISNLMFHFEKNIDNLSHGERDLLYMKILREFEKLILSVKKNDKELVMVSNEVGMGLISDHSLGRLFTDYQGFINQYLAKESDNVIFMVSGLPLVLKGEKEGTNE